MIALAVAAVNSFAGGSVARIPKDIRGEVIRGGSRRVGSLRGEKARASKKGVEAGREAEVSLLSRRLGYRVNCLYNSLPREGLGIWHAADASGCISQKARLQKPSTSPTPCVEGSSLPRGD